MENEKQKTEKNLTVRQPMQRSRNLPSSYRDIFGQPFLPASWGSFLGEEQMWAPAIHILEKDDKFVAKVELPGVQEEDINVSIVGDVLVVEGEKESDSEVKKKGYSYSETSYGSFSRSIPIPSIVDAEGIIANFDKGILEIDPPKMVQLMPKKVNVTTKKKPKTIGKEEPAESVGENKSEKK